MPGKLFVNYRRDDDRTTAARIRDHLAAAFGEANVFMDVDNLIAGQRFDKELEKALSQTDVFLAVIGPRWAGLLTERQASGEIDYVREEIAGALRRGIAVIPVLIEGTPLPRTDALPEDIRHIVLHHAHEVAYAWLGRDLGKLIEAIRCMRKAAQAEAGGGAAAVRWVGAVALMALLVLGGGIMVYKGVPVPWALNGSAGLKGQEELRAGQVFRDCLDCPQMVVLPAGEFMMGSLAETDEGPVHEVAIKRPFAVGKFEVTFDEWDACVAGGGCTSNPRPGDSGWGRARRPVINVSWHDAKEYVAWLSRKTGKAYRLLSEAEWEYAAGAGTPTRYTFGDGQSAATSTAKVGSFPANKFGLHDMLGNVWEWCADNWHATYKGAPGDGSVRAGGDQFTRVLRGGSWEFDYRVARPTNPNFSLGERITA